MNLGYACINMQLSYPQKYGGQEKGVKPITTGRSMIKRTFESKGLDYASELTLQNCKDLDKIVDWNILNGFKFFRITSGLAPWKSEYEWEDLKDLKWIKTYLKSAGIKAKTHGLTIVAAEDVGDRGPWDVDLRKDTLLVVGAERDGVSQETLEAADFVVKLPMDGFVPSYNLQVAVSVLAVEALRQKLE